MSQYFKYSFIPCCMLKFTNFYVLKNEELRKGSNGRMKKIM